MRDNLDDNEKEHLRKEDIERKKERRVTWTMMRKISLENMRKKRKKVMRDNLDDNEKEHLRKEDIERKKERRVTWTMMRKIS